MRDRIHSISSASASSATGDGHAQIEPDTTSPVGTDTVRTMSDGAGDAFHPLVLGLTVDETSYESPPPLPSSSSSPLQQQQQPEQQQQQGNDEPVNLDYLYLDAMCVPPSPDEDMEYVSGDPYGGGKQPQPQQEEDCPPEQRQFDQTAAGFDPQLVRLCRSFLVSRGLRGSRLGNSPCRYTVDIECDCQSMSDCSA